MMFSPTGVFLLFSRMLCALVTLSNICCHHAFIKHSPWTEMLGTDVRGKENISNRKWYRSSSIYGISTRALSEIQTKAYPGAKPSGSLFTTKICVKRFWELLVSALFKKNFSFFSLWNICCLSARCWGILPGTPSYVITSEDLKEESAGKK